MKIGNTTTENNQNSDLREHLAQFRPPPGCGPPSEAPSLSSSKGQGAQLEAPDRLVPSRTPRGRRGLTAFPDRQFYRFELAVTRFRQKAELGSYGQYLKRLGFPLPKKSGIGFLEMRKLRNANFGKKLVRRFLA